MKYKARIERIEGKVKPKEVDQYFCLIKGQDSDPEQIKTRKEMAEWDKLGKAYQVFEITIVKTKEDLREVKNV